MYSLLLCISVALALGFSGTLFAWWGWIWALVFSTLAFLVVGVLWSRRLSAKIQPIVQRAQVQMQEGNLAGAMSTFEVLLGMSHWVPMLKGQVLAQMGILANFQGDQDKAVKLLEGASLKSADARLALGCIVYKKGDIARAMSILKLAAAVNKKHALLHNTYAWMLHKNERGDEAQAVIAAYLKRDPGHGPSKDNLLRLQNRTRMTMHSFEMQWYALGLEHPPQAMGQMRRAPKGFREPPKRPR